MNSRFESLLSRCRSRRRRVVARRIAAVSLLLVSGGVAAYLTHYEGPFLSSGGEKREVETVAVTAAPGHAETAGVKPAEREAEPETARSAESKREIEKSGGETVLKEKSTALQKSEKSEPKEIKKESVKPEEKMNEDSRRALLGPKAEPQAEKNETKPKVVLEIREVADIDALLERYANAPRYSLALKIARTYYDDGDFEKASLWARKANILDRDDERAWIIYAQSEYALGREERAKRILRLFLDYKDSAKARSLLMTWGRE